MNKALEKLIYTKTAAIAITNKPVIEVKVWANVVFVKFKKGSPRFVSKKAFRKEFAASRQRRGQQIKDAGLVQSQPADSNSFLVQCSQSFDLYVVQLEDKYVSCMCKDWDRQRQAGIHTPTCKHGYAVLQTLGYSRLSEYVRQRKYDHQLLCDRA